MTDKRDYICRGPNCWGRGETPRAALAAARKHLPSFTKPKPGQTCYVVHDCPPGASVNGMGGLDYKIVRSNDPVYAPPQVYGHYDINGRIPNGL